MSNPSIDGLRDLSDEDVRLLYDIVTAAEASRSPPFRALFTAYEQQLAKRGISKDHDQLYLRFLLRMGENRKEGHGLYDQFESLLSKLGFQVAFDGEDKENEEWEGSDDPDQSASPPKINLLQTQSFRPSRRASFDSAFENNTDTQPLSTLPARRRSIDGFSQVYAKSRRDEVKPFDHGSRIATRPRPSNSGPKADDEPHESDETLAEDSKILSGGSDVSNEVPEFIPERPPVINDPHIKDVNPMKNIETKKRQLEANARTLKYHHVAARAVLFFRRWSDSTRKSRDKHDQMYSIALRHDANILVRQALDQWRLVLHEKRQRRETEKFFENLEIRAGKARGLFLLTKSFTHWAQCASEETSRRRMARKLILQTRYFNAWRDITVVNELKARRLCLSKFFSIWIKRTERVFDNEDQAMEFNTATLIQYVYRQWFWAFCERRTPSWYLSKRKDSIFKKWLGLAREAMIRKAWAIDFRNLELSSGCISQWTRRSGLVLQNQHDAASFRSRALLGPTVETLRRELQLAPVKSHLSQVSALRITRSALYLWIGKTRDIRSASRTNELRIMRNAWTQWNDSLRCHALSRIIDDRVILQTLYQWVLAERLVICEKAKSDYLRRSVLVMWRGKMNSLSATLGHARSLAVRSQEKRLTSSAIKTWSTRSQAEQHEDLRANSFRDKRLISKSLNSWVSRFRHLTKMEKWSEDARFFILASRSLKNWRTRTVATKRNRRRDAFASFRRKAKSSTTKRILDRWSHITHAKNQLAVRATEAQQQRLILIGTNLFDHWRERSSVFQMREEQADIFWTTHTLMRCVQLLISRLRLLETYEARAYEVASGMMDAGAVSALRKLNWRAFQLKRQHESADSLLQRNRKKHYRHMLRYWASFTIQRKQLRQSTAEDKEQLDAHGDIVISSSVFARQGSPLTSRTLRHDGSQSTSRLEMSRTSQGLAATPGYLRTPSRRTVLGKLRAHTSSLAQPVTAESRPQEPKTPSMTRITPFMNRIRAQYPTSNLASGSRSARVDLVAQVNMADARSFGFEDIPESPLLEFQALKDSNEGV